MNGSSHTAVRFLEPWWLAVLAIVPLLVAIWLSAWKRQRARLKQYCDEELFGLASRARSSAWFAARKIAVLSGVCLVALAMARPKLYASPGSEQVVAGDVVICIDLSRSMLVKDVAPDRFTRAAAVARELIQRLPENRYGLVAFAGLGLPQCPVTTSTEIVEEQILSMHPGELGETLAGTNIEDALRQAGSMLERAGGTSGKAVVLLTDGEDHEGKPLSAAADLAQAGIGLVSVGVGTKDGGPVPWYLDRPGGPYMKDEFGEVVKSRLAVELLEELAKVANGAYVDGTSADASGEIASYLSGLEREVALRRTRESARELYQVPLFLAFLAFVSAACMPGKRRAHNGGPGLGMTAVLIWAASILLEATGFDVFSSAHPDVDDAIRAIEAGRPSKAVDLMQGVVEELPDSADAMYDLAIALHDTAEVGKAVEAFEEAYTMASKGGDEKISFKTLYNLGAVAMESGSMEDAVEFYRRALLLDGTDMDAKINLELVLKRLKQAESARAQDLQDRSSKEESREEPRAAENEAEDGTKGQEDRQRNDTRTRAYNLESPAARRDASAVKSLNMARVERILETVKQRRNALPALNLLPRKYKPRRTDKPW